VKAPRYCMTRAPSRRAQPVHEGQYGFHLIAPLRRKIPPGIHPHSFDRGGFRDGQPNSPSLAQYDAEGVIQCALIRRGQSGPVLEP